MRELFETVEGGSGEWVHFRRLLQGLGGCGLARRGGESRQAGRRGTRQWAVPLGEKLEIYRKKEEKRVDLRKKRGRTELRYVL